MGCRADGMSRKWDVAQLGCRAVEMSRNWDVAQLKCRATEMSRNWEVAQLKWRANKMSLKWDVALEKSRANDISPSLLTDQTHLKRKSEKSSNRESNPGPHLETLMLYHLLVNLQRSL